MYRGGTFARATETNDDERAAKGESVRNGASLVSVGATTTERARETARERNVRARARERVREWRRRVQV